MNLRWGMGGGVGACNTPNWNSWLLAPLWCCLFKIISQNKRFQHNSLSLESGQRSVSSVPDILIVLWPCKFDAMGWITLWTRWGWKWEKMWKVVEEEGMLRGHNGEIRYVVTHFSCTCSRSSRVFVVSNMTAVKWPSPYSPSYSSMYYDVQKNLMRGVSRALTS